MKQLLVAKVNADSSNKEEINRHMDKVVKNATSKFLNQINEASKVQG